MVSDISARIRCSTGSEWKSRNEFSNNQLRKFETAFSCGRASAGDSGHLVPSAYGHSSLGIAVQRAMRQIPLHRQLHKNARHNGTLVCDLYCCVLLTAANQVQWCKQCTEWQLSDEVDRHPPGPP